jgi:hypothetical protein
MAREGGPSSIPCTSDITLSYDYWTYAGDDNDLDSADRDTGDVFVTIIHNSTGLASRRQ